MPAIIEFTQNVHLIGTAMYATLIKNSRRLNVRQYRAKFMENVIPFMHLNMRFSKRNIFSSLFDFFLNICIFCSIFTFYIAAARRRKNKTWENIRGHSFFPKDAISNRTDVDPKITRFAAFTMTSIIFTPLHTSIHIMMYANQEGKDFWQYFRKHFR